MRDLVLHPTDICQWHAIIGEAQGHSQVLLAEDTESYLVFLLMRFNFVIIRDCKNLEKFYLLC